MRRLIPTIVVIVALLLAWMSVYVVDQRQYALVSQFGQVVSVVQTPGVYFKVPVVQSTEYFDKRIQTIAQETPDQFDTRDKQTVLADSVIKWRIVNVTQFYKKLNNRQTAAERLHAMAKSALQAQFAQRTLAEVLSGQRDQMLNEVRKQLNSSAGKDFGVQIVDVRLTRLDFPEALTASVYERMRAERQGMANQLRSEGVAEADVIRADANSQRDIILAEAYRQAQQLKGEGDAQAAAIYAESYGKNPEFYAFWRSMEAYKASFKDRKDVLIVDPSLEFFRYFRQPQSGSTK